MSNKADVEIEHLLFKQVAKPKNLLMVRSINVFDDRYRVNVYVEIQEHGLTKRKISNSYFCIYNSGSLKIKDGLDPLPIKLKF